MPNDPSIPLSVNVAVPKFNTPFEQLGQVYALRGAKLNQDLTQQEINTGKSLEDERRQKVEHGQRVQQAWQGMNALGRLPTDEELAQAMTQVGEDPSPYLKESSEQRDRLAKLKASQLKNQEDETNLVAEAMASVAKDGYDPHHFALKVAQLKQGGIDTTLLEKSIQEHPERTKEIIDALAQSNKQQEVTDKAQAAADLHSELPGKLPDPATGLTPSQAEASKRGMAAQAEAARHNRAEEGIATQKLSLTGGSAADPETVAAYVRMVKQNGTLVDVPVTGGMRNAVMKVLGENGVDVQKLTSQDISRKNIAKTLLPKFDSVAQMAKDIDKLGLTGSLGGRWRKLVSGETAASDLSGLTPAQKQLVGRFASEASGLLMSGIAMAHGGARGGGSPQLLEQVKRYLDPANKDLDVYLGNLAGAREFISGYATMGESETPKAGGKGDPLGIR